MESMVYTVLSDIPTPPMEYSTMEEHSGFSNRATRLVNLWFLGDFCEPMTAREIEDMVFDHVGSQVGFVADLIGASLNCIDWEELAERTQEEA